MAIHGLQLITVATALILAVVSVAGTAAAQSKFGGVELVAAPRHFMVKKDARIRAKPNTKSKSIGRLKKGTRVVVAGRAKGGLWFAVVKDGKPLGFVYGTIITPLIDGTLTKPVIGRLKQNGKPSCDYTLRFDRKTKTDGELLETSDYEVKYACRADNVTVKFLANMFITELPYRLTTKETYQINLDLLDVLEVPGLEDSVLSVTVMFHADKNHVVFDSTNRRTPDAKHKKKISSKTSARRANSVVAALVGAIEIAYGAWDRAVFSALAKRGGS